MSSNTPAHRWGAVAFMAGSAPILLKRADGMGRHFLGRPMPGFITGDRTMLVLGGQIAFALGFLTCYRHCAPRLIRAGRLVNNGRRCP